MTQPSAWSSFFASQ